MDCLWVTASYFPALQWQTMLVQYLFAEICLRAWGARAEYRTLVSCKRGLITPAVKFCRSSTLRNIFAFHTGQVICGDNIFKNCNVIECITEYIVAALIILRCKGWRMQDPAHKYCMQTILLDLVLGGSWAGSQRSGKIFVQPSLCKYKSGANPASRNQG